MNLVQKKDNYMEKYLEFNNKKQCGLWLIAVGLVLIVSTIFGGKYLINPFIFVIGYYICFFAINMNKFVRKKLSNGPLSKFQLKMIYISLASLFILMFAIAGPFFPGWNFRYIWIGVLLATSIHFLLWFFIHGYSMLILGSSGIIISIVGYTLPSASIQLLYYIDAATKLLFGLYLLFISKPTKLKIKNA